MPTGTETAKRILRILGVIDPGETPDAALITFAIESINGLLNSLLNQNITVYSTVRESFDLVSGTATYTIGSGGTFDTVRPNEIDYAFIKSGGYDYELDIVDERKYESILDKSTQGRPYLLYYKPEYPLGILKFFFTPDSSGDDVYLMSRKPLTSVVMASDYDYPPGFDDMICFNTALRVAPEYGIEPGFNLIREAQKTLDAVIAQNFKNNMKESRIEITHMVEANKRNILNY